MCEESTMSLPEILRILVPLESKYFELGIQLGLTVEHLKEITAKYTSDKRCLEETIALWKNIDNSCKSHWSSLADAVERVGAFDDTARKLRRCCDKVDEGLHKELSVESLQHHCGSDNTERSSVSRSSPDTSESEIDHFDFVRGCGCSSEKPCSLYMLSTGGCPKPTNVKLSVIKKRIPVINTQPEEDDMEARFSMQTKVMRRNFARLISETACSFEMRKVDIKELILFVQHSFLSTKETTEDMIRATSIDQVFMIIAKEGGSWFDYGIIKALINYFGTAEDKHRLARYEDQFKQFAERRLMKGMKYLDIGGGAIKGGEHERLVLKIDREWDKVTFNDLHRLKYSVASILEIHPSALMLTNVQEGCIMMTFTIPKELAERLFPTRCCLTSSQIKSFKETGVLSVTCGKLSWQAGNILYRVIPYYQAKAIRYISDKPSVAILSLCFICLRFIFNQVV